MLLMIPIFYISIFKMSVGVGLKLDKVMRLVLVRKMICIKIRSLDAKIHL